MTIMLFQSCTVCRGQGEVPVTRPDRRMTEFDKCRRCRGRGEELTPDGAILRQFVKNILEEDMERKGPGR